LAADEEMHFDVVPMGGKKQPKATSTPPSSPGKASVMSAGHAHPPQPAEDAPKGILEKSIAIMEGKYVQTIMTLTTVFALFGEDMRLYSFPKSADHYFYALFIFSLLCFATELTINSIIQEGYKWSFFFWLDLVATLSLVPDIKYFIDPVNFLLGIDTSTSSVNATAARAGRASRAGTRAGRIVRLVRLVRLVRVVNVTKCCSREAELTEEEKELKRLEEEERQRTKNAHDAQRRVEASRLGKILSEQTTRRVIIGVLCVLFVLPNLSYEESDNSGYHGLQQLFYYGSSFCNTPNADFACKYGLPHSSNDSNAWLTTEGWRYMVYAYATSSKTQGEKESSTGDLAKPLLWLRIPDFEEGGRIHDIRRVESPQGTWEADVKCDSFQTRDECKWRESEVELVVFTPEECLSSNACREINVAAKFLKKDYSVQSAGMSMLTTIFIVFLLGAGAMTFSKDTQTLVIEPIEKMVNIVKQLADDPLNKPEVVDEDYEEFAAMNRKKGSNQLETSMLENTILKIGGLLQVGFGEAGAPIIGKNMSNESGDIDYMIPGRKVIAIYGFAEIQDFQDITECLLEEVMVFVNKIARIVHTCVHEWGGAANKNIGDAFLLVWLLLETEDQKKLIGVSESRQGTPVKTPLVDVAPQTRTPEGHPSDDELGLTRTRSKFLEEKDVSERMTELADRALVSFIKIIAEIRRASDLSAYAKHPKIIPKFGLNYAVHIGFGLHCGWSIEGAIGSEYKIDASYLSLHVNIAARLQSATKQYGVDLLMSQHMYQTLSPKARDRCRQLDVVMLKGTKTPVGIFCFDVNKKIFATPEGHMVGQMIPPNEMTMETLAAKGVDWMFLMDQDIVNLQKGISLEFQSTWRQAFAFYIEGEWTRALEMLQKCLALMPGDGPSEALALYMKSQGTQEEQEHRLAPPADWSGSRALHAK